MRELISNFMLEHRSTSISLLCVTSVANSRHESPTILGQSVKLHKPVTQLAIQFNNMFKCGTGFFYNAL